MQLSFFFYFSACLKIDGRIIFTVTCHGTLLDIKRVNADDIFEEYNFMTEIPENRCLKILCKFSFVAKNT